MYLSITNKTNNEHFGLFSIRPNRIENFINMGSATSTREGGLGKGGISNGDAKPVTCTKKGIKIFNDKKELLYDIDGLPLFDRSGKRLYNLNTNNKRVKVDGFSNIEEFFMIGGGNTTNITNTTNIKKTYENNQKINRSMQVESTNKLFNDVANDVVQSNLASSAAAAGALNSIDLHGVKCDNIKISNINQDASAVFTLISEQKQKQISTISSDIATSIDKKIEKAGGTDIGELQANNLKQMNDFMNATPGYDPDAAGRIAGGVSNIGFGNTTNVNNSYSLDANVKSALDLDESFKIKDDDEIKNTINNKISQTNIAKCQGSGSSANQVNLSDIACKNMELSDIKQKAATDVLVKCMFDQEAVSEITTKITNKISKQFNQIYDKVTDNIMAKYCPGQEKEAMQEYFSKMAKVDTIAGANSEVLAIAAGKLPAKGDMPIASPATSNIIKDKPSNKSTSSSVDRPTRDDSDITDRRLGKNIDNNTSGASSSSGGASGSSGSASGSSGSSGGSSGGSSRTSAVASGTSAVASGTSAVASGTSAVASGTSAVASGTDGFVLTTPMYVGIALFALLLLYFSFRPSAPPVYYPRYY
jgi:uncharacterized membrane protein YgcG